MFSKAIVGLGGLYTSASVKSLLIFVVRVTVRNLAAPCGPRTNVCEDVSIGLRRRNPMHLFCRWSSTIPLLIVPPLSMAGVNSPTGEELYSSYTSGSDRRNLHDSTKKRNQR
jgi:hypothetical protein